MRLGTRSVTILGSGGVVGGYLLNKLAEDKAVSSIVVADPKAPEGMPRKASHELLDLTLDSSIDMLAELIDRADPDTLIHMGYLNDRDETQEAHSAETARIIKALSRRPVPKVIFISSTVVYGAVPGDPTHLSERTLLSETPHSDWVRDKVDSEKAIKDFLLDSDAIVTILRLALPLGPTISNFMTRYLRRKAVPVVMGVDPSVQFIHERDAAAAIQHCIHHDHDGPFNIVGDGALPLSVALRIGRRRSAPVPELGSYPLHHALWDPDIVEAPDVLQDLFHYIWVADGTRARTVMKFNPRHSTKETVEDFYKPKNRG